MRLAHRAQRIERALLVLRARRTHADAAGVRHLALERSISGFGAELDSVRTRLRMLS
jgi:hypothetical protein